MLETSVESVLVQGVKARGGVALKLQPFVAGVPDRIVLMPGGRTYLVELKQTNEHPTKIQRHWHDRLRRDGHSVAVLRGADQVREWMSQL